MPLAHYAFPVVFAASALYLFVSAKDAAAGGYPQWGRHGRPGRTMSAFGARCFGTFLLSLSAAAAVDATGIRWLKICTYVVVAGCFLLATYAWLWDADIV